MILFPVLAALLSGGVIPREPLECRISPQAILVGAFYNGADVTLEGGVAAGSGVVVTVTGSDNEAVFNRKARFGPIWINSGKVRISRAPSMFLRFSSAPISGLLRPDAIAEYRLDEASLMRAMRTEPLLADPRAETALRANYLSLKKSEGSYSLGGSPVGLTSTARGASFALRFRWPRQAPPGEYAIHIYEVSGGAVVRQREVIMPVQRTGFPARLAALAGDHASRYGITAIVTGVIAGFGIDFLATLLFGKKRAVSH